MISNKLVIGVLAHVDAGKTTLSEGMLYLSGSIRKLGRVDHQDAFFDTYALERERGITIFSKQAQLPLGIYDAVLLDTPGHIDFSAEMERTLQVLDYGILIVNASDGIQGHTMTLWKLCRQYRVPVFVFVNKMDLAEQDEQEVLSQLKKKLDGNCTAFCREDREQFYEELALCDETVLEQYLETGSIPETRIAGFIRERKVFPCYFGSALKMEGVREFLDGLHAYLLPVEYPEAFGAKVFKITRDKQGNRLTHMKITGGSLKTKDFISNRRDIELPALGENEGKSETETEIWEEKADQIRVYSGEKYTACTAVSAGTICSVTGLTKTYPGEGLGIERESIKPLLEPVLVYRILPPAGTDASFLILKLLQLQEEDPLLQIVWNESLNEIHIRVMGEVELEILKEQIKERFGLTVTFGSGGLLYKETIKHPVIGVGHFEPLRHYAEVHLLLEPLECGQGLVFESGCSEDILGKSWQRLVLSHLAEKKHKGVLTGSDITDMRITLINGRAHLKHTEGGDFRQAVYRAVRQGLRKAESILLEPVYAFRLEIPVETLGRAMSDIQRMHGTAAESEVEGDTALLTGYAPVSEIWEYQKEVTAYSRGSGRLFLNLDGYAPCHNQEEVIQKIGYDFEQDMQNPAGSVFCAHGAGFYVSWDMVDSYQHLESTPPAGTLHVLPEPKRNTEGSRRHELSYAQEKELEEIFVRTYGAAKRDTMLFRKPAGVRKTFEEMEYPPKRKQESKERYLLVDGYNIIFAWKELKELAAGGLEPARLKLLDLLCGYQGYTETAVIVVFDAYKVEGNIGKTEQYHNVHVVYTKEAETADQYIEKTVHKIGKQYDVTVATSDALEQMIVWGSGAKRISAAGLFEELLTVEKEIEEIVEQQNSRNRNLPFLEIAGEMKLEE